MLYFKDKLLHKLDNCVILMAVLPSLHRFASSHRSQTLVVPSLPGRCLSKPICSISTLSCVEEKLYRERAEPGRAGCLRRIFLQQRNK